MSETESHTRVLPTESIAELADVLRVRGVRQFSMGSMHIEFFAGMHDVVRKQPTVEEIAPSVPQNIEDLLYASSDPAPFPHVK